MYAAYNILLFIAGLVLVPWYLAKMLLTGKYRKSLGPKFGLIPSELIDNMKGSPRIWVHAVSVGEVTAAAPIISSLRERFPTACILLSTGTETGQEMARGIALAATSYIYYPLDIPFVVRKMIDLVRPDIFVAVETELWPNFIRICKKKRVRVVLVNGRISQRSFKNYFRTRFFWRKVLRLIDETGVISEVDAARIRVLGAPPFRVHVLGNAKYDGLAAGAAPELMREISLKLNMAEGSRVFVAGSTHAGEEEIIFEVYRRLLEEYPDFKLIIIPRHVERGSETLSLAEKAGFRDCITMTGINGGRKHLKERIVIVDVIGELFKAYSLAAIVFCGGSLVRKGGQNILEPAAWGKVVFYGPFMEDFRDEKVMLEEAGAGITVRNGEELLKGILTLMKDPEDLLRKGNEGRKKVISNMGASRRYAKMITCQINENIKMRNGK